MSIVSTAISRLPSILRKPNTVALLTALLQPLDEAVESMRDVGHYFDLRYAYGDIQDLLGKLLVIARDGNSDEDYRRLQNAKIAVDSSKGVVESLITVVDLVLGVDSDVEVINDGGAEARIVVHSPALSDTVAQQLLEFLTRAAAVGVRIQLVSQSEPDNAEMFVFGRCLYLISSTSIGDTVVEVSATNADGFPQLGSVIINDGLADEETAVFQYVGPYDTYPHAIQFSAPLATAHGARSTLTLVNAGKGMGSTSNPAAGGKLATVRVSP